MPSQNDDWLPLAGGGFNVAYVNPEYRLVFKSVMNDKFTTDGPERSVRLWNLFNPTLKPKAKVVTLIIDGKKCRGWTCPYVKTKYSPTTTCTEQDIEIDRDSYRKAMIDPTRKNEEDTTIARALLGIYNRTGRIIIDASIPGNLIVTAENKVVCVDVGMALILEEKEDDCLHRYARRKSIVSNEAWELVHRDGIDERILKDNKSELPKTLMTTRALLFIRTHRPDISNVDFLNNDPSLLEKLSKAYNSEIKDDAIQLLEDKQPVSLSGVKYACTQALQKYIDSRGSMDENRKFSASRLTKWFRNEVAVRRKVDCAEKLIGKINQARSIVEIESALNDTSHNPSFSKGWMSGFMRCIGLCRVITQVQQSHELTTQITPLHRS